MSLPKLNKGPGYIQTKIRVCQSVPFVGLGELGMWYSFCLKTEIETWNSQWKTASFGAATDWAAFCLHPHGYHIRRVATDGKLLKVYDSNGQILNDSLLPISVLGENCLIIRLSEVEERLRSWGGRRHVFAVNGKPYTGQLLKGRKYCAAWTEDQIGLLFETNAGVHPNGKVIEQLEPD